MILRAIALFFGGFSLLSFALGLVVPRFDANIWWIDVSVLPRALERLALPVISASLLAYALLGVPAGRRRWLLIPGLGLMAGLVAHNTVAFYALLLQGEIRTRVPVPLSLLLLVPAVLLLQDAWRDPARRPARPARPRDRVVAAAVVGVLGALFPVAQMICFGSTDYRRPADAIVVFGARAYADGRMSTALHDRARTGVDLHQAGLAPLLVFSGGPGDGDVHETEAMRRYAVARGVPDSAIVRDQDGLSTQHTVDNTAPGFRQHGQTRILAVSQWYHLPRIKLAYARAGINAYTVPAEPSAPLYGLPWFMFREVGGFWIYYLRPLLP
jgi:uncharacterized SAM-binding protein YcdF (DUF218 family)